MSTIYLLRHGEIAGSYPRRFIGRTELPLTPTGKEQIVHLAEFLAQQSIDRVVSSPLLRCRQSAEILGERLRKPVEVFPELAEINLGTWEGLTVAEVEKRYPGAYEARGLDIAAFRPENGESFLDVLFRAWPVFEALGTRIGERIAVVGHAGVNRVLLYHVLELPLANLFRLEQRYGCVNILKGNTTGLQVNSLNLFPAISAESDCSFTLSSTCRDGIAP